MTIKTLKTIADLLRFELIPLEEVARLARVVEQFNVAITPSLLPLMNNPGIAKQFLPSPDELEVSSKELSDPIGDSKYEKVKGLIHRYPDRCLLKVVNVCPVYCRFCFRKEMIGPGKDSLTLQDLGNAYEYIREHPEIWEVILTGGDPLILKNSRLEGIISSLSAIKHVEVLRIHTRIPVIEPFRITPDLINILRIPNALYIALHANHPKEFTQEAIEACARIVDAGIPMLSQSVLLKGVNDDPETLSQLMKAFVRNRIKPYYLHHLDLAKGTNHFRKSIEEGQQLIKYLNGRFSGLCQPNYMLDIPGGFGKVPIGPCYLHTNGNDCWVEDYLGQLHPA